MQLKKLKKKEKEQNIVTSEASLTVDDLIKAKEALRKFNPKDDTVRELTLFEIESAHKLFDSAVRIKCIKQYKGDGNDGD